MKFATLIGLALAGLAATVSPLSFAAGGELDPTFGNAGVYVGALRDNSARIAVDSLGRIYEIRAGSGESPPTLDAVLTRLTPSGQPDLGYGPGGRRLVPAPVFCNLGNVHGFVATQPDDKVLYVTRMCGGTDAFEVRRANADGTPDGTFTPITQTVTGSGSVLALPYPDGRILFLAPSSLKRYLADGSPDPSFIPQQVSATHAAVAADGRVVLGGPGDGVSRRVADGSADPTFGNGGTVLGPGREVALVAVQPDGKVLAAGLSRSGALRAGNDTVWVARFTTTGALDPAFGNGGMVDVLIEAQPRLAGLFVQQDGKIAFAVTDVSAGRKRVGLARLTSAGALDASFGAGGIWRFDLGPDDDPVSDMQLQTGGDFIVGTHLAGGALKVARISGGGNAIRLEPLWLLPGGVGQAYSSTLSASGGAAPYTFSSIGALPPGLAVSGTMLTGTPTAAGQYRFFLQATDSNGAQATHHYVLNVHTAASLIGSYYRSILGRAPDAGGQAFWESEVARVTALGASVNDVFHALASTFFTSPEYPRMYRGSWEFVGDFYGTYLGRDPDYPGLAYWSGQSKPLGALRNDFQFSPEFAQAMANIFGAATGSRAETSMVIDFYRGVLARLPDSGGFGYWVGRFRSAQCAGTVTAEADAVSAAFVGSQEYASRQAALTSPAERDSEFIVDLYGAFLRRGSDVAGFQYWFDEVQSGRRTREQVRQAFVQSAEFQARVASVQAAGCQQ